MQAIVGQEAPPPKCFLPSLSKTRAVGDLICEYCLKSGKLSRCSGCQRVSYCSGDCQRKDWKIQHKLLCPQFKKVNQFDKEIVGDRALSLLEYIQTDSQRTEILSQWGSLHHDRVFIQYQTHCAVCHRTPFQRRTFQPFRKCNDCHLVRWCSDECHAKLGEIHDATDCKFFRDLFALERFETDYCIARKTPARQYIVGTVAPRASPLYPSQCKDWDVLFSKIQSDPLKEFELCGREFATSNPDPATGARMMITEALSPLLTVLSALEVAIPRLAQQEELILHIVGIEDREVRGTRVYEELLHFLPRLKHLRIFYVGPTPGFGIPSKTTTNSACAICQSRRRVRACSFHIRDYRTFLREEELKGPFKKPNLIIGFNTGMTEVEPESWKTAVDEMLRLQVPVLFTAYSLPEANMEATMFEARTNVKFLLPVERNKWRGVVPTINIMNKMFSRDGEGVTYASNYQYMVQGKGST